MFTIAEVAERLRVSASTVYNLVENGQLECHRIGIGRGTIRISEEQVREYLERSRAGQNYALALRDIKPPSSARS